jgi:hypothetical protein
VAWAFRTARSVFTASVVDAGGVIVGWWKPRTDDRAVDTLVRLDGAGIPVWSITPTTAVADSPTVETTASAGDRVFGFGTGPAETPDGPTMWITGFSTVATAPLITASTPAAGAVDVDPALREISLDVDRPVTLTDRSAVRLRDLATGRYVPASASVTSGTRIVLRPIEALDPGRRYLVVLTDGVRDTAGTPLLRRGSITFTTLPASEPQS